MGAPPQLSKDSQKVRRPYLLNFSRNLDLYFSLFCPPGCACTVNPYCTVLYGSLRGVRAVLYLITVVRGTVFRAVLYVFIRREKNLSITAPFGGPISGSPWYGTVHRLNTTLFVRSNILANPRIALSIVGLFEAYNSAVPKFPSLEYSLAFHFVIMIWDRKPRPTRLHSDFATIHLVIWAASFLVVCDFQNLVRAFILRVDIQNHKVGILKVVFEIIQQLAL